eukprot:GHVS01014412.1.p1 GENE.GHVS01014412.1~~GHVS01014412.1.p1  ORF type:complete len:973 (+),score=227.47 GHVS01014412.1:410-3328(+)
MVLSSSPSLPLTESATPTIRSHDSMGRPPSNNFNGTACRSYPVNHLSHIPPSSADSFTRPLPPPSSSPLSSRHLILSSSPPQCRRASPPRPSSLSSPPPSTKIGYSISRASTADSAGSELGTSTHSDEKHGDHHNTSTDHQRATSLPPLGDCPKSNCCGGCGSDDEDDQEEGRAGLAEHALQELLADILGPLGVPFNRTTAEHENSCGGDEIGGGEMCRDYIKEADGVHEMAVGTTPTPTTTGTSPSSTPPESPSALSPSPALSSAVSSPRSSSPLPSSLPTVSCVDIRRTILEAVTKHSSTCSEVNLAQLLQQLVKYVRIDQTDLDQPSLGALLHAHGICKPCVFANKNSKVCHNGSSCYFCHHYHKERRRRSKKTKKDIDIPPPPPLPLSSPVSNSGRVRIPPPPSVPPPPPPPPYSSAPPRPYRTVVAAASGGGAVRTPSTLNRSAMPFHPFSPTTATTTTQPCFLPSTSPRDATFHHNQQQRPVTATPRLPPSSPPPSSLAGSPTGPAEMASLLLSDLSSDVLMKLHEAIHHAVLAKQIQEDTTLTTTPPIPTVADSNNSTVFRSPRPKLRSSGAFHLPSSSPLSRTPRTSAPFHLGSFPLPPLPPHSIPPPPPGLSLPRNLIPPPPPSTSNAHPRSPCFSLLTHQYPNFLTQQQQNERNNSSREVFHPVHSPTTTITASSHCCPPQCYTHGTQTTLPVQPPTAYSSSLFAYVPDSVREAPYSPQSKFGQQSSQQSLLSELASSSAFVQAAASVTTAPQTPSGRNLLLQRLPSSSSRLNPHPPPLAVPAINSEPYCTPTAGGSDSALAALLLSPSFINFLSSTSPSSQHNTTKHEATFGSGTVPVTASVGGGGGPSPPMLSTNSVFTYQRTPSPEDQQHQQLTRSSTYSTTQPSTPRYTSSSSPFDPLQFPTLSPELCTLLALAAANSAGVSAEELQDILRTLPDRDEGGEGCAEGASSPGKTDEADE